MIKCIKTSFFTLPFCTNFAIMFYVYKLIQKGEEIMNENKEFKPYIPADKITPEFTVTSIIMGVILAVIFGAANAYLGLRVGMTVSASIPAAVISMGVIRKIMKKNSILDKCAIPLLRLRTDGSGEKEKIKNALKKE